MRQPPRPRQPRAVILARSAYGVAMVLSGLDPELLLQRQLSFDVRVEIESMREERERDGRS
jgi:hypothetical protein